MRRALSRKAASLLLRRLLRALAASFDGAARLTQKMPTFGLILNCNFSSVSNGNERVCSRSGYLGMAARPSAGAPCHTRGKPPQHPTPPNPPGGQWNCRLPRCCLAGERAGPYQPRLARGGGGLSSPPPPLARLYSEAARRAAEPAERAAKGGWPGRALGTVILSLLPLPFCARKW